MSRCYSTLFALLSTVLPVLGQLATNTSIVGKISDSTGAAITIAQVTARNQETGETLNTTSTEIGTYEFQFLKAGVYTVSVQMAGFATTSQKDVAVSTNQTARADFSLKVGSVDTTVEITADIPPIKTDDASMSELITTKSTTELPLNGRNPIKLAAMTPGVIPGLKTPTGNPGGGEGYIGAGLREITNSVSLDGVSLMNNLITTTTYRPSVDAIQEVQVQTGTYPAQYGGYLGVQINMITKSGGNDFHGALFEFLRNDKLDAKNFFTAKGQNKPPLRQNQYGVQFNGPVVIPKVYNGKNKTFFMFGWESLRSGTQIPTVASVLTPKMRAGDFSETSVVVKDPYTGIAFPGNVVPASRLSPQAIKALQYMPLPTNGGTVNAFTNNFIRNAPANNTTDQYLGRLDQTLGERNRFFFRYSYEDTKLVNENANPYNGYNQPVGDRNFVVGYTRIFSSSIVNDFRFGRQYTTIDSLNFFTPGGAYPSTAGTALGIPGFPTSDTNPGLPAIGITNFISIGADNQSSTNWFQNDKTYQISNTTSFVKAAHNISAGIDSRKVITNRTANNNPRGGFTFNGQLSGFAPADFLLGIPQAITTPGQLYPGGGEQWRYGFFVQDKWQVTSNLTLTLGLRYELPTVPESTTGNGTILNPAQTAFIPSTVPQKIPYNNPDHNNWGPRFGFAYRLPSKFVVRGGFGVYYNPNQMNSYTLATTNPPFATIFTFNNSLVSGILPSTALTFANPLPAAGGSTNSRPNAFTVSPYLPNGAMNQWSFSLERGLWRTAGFGVEYLGNHAYHLDRSFYPNTPAPGPGAVNDRRPNPLFGVIRVIQNDLVSNYQGLSQVYRQNGFKGLTMLASYTFSKTLDVSTDSNGGSNVMNPYNWRLDYGLANWDVRHRFVASYNYELPFFKGSDNKLIKTVLAGWQTNGITTAQSGLPFSATISADQANVGQGTQRANYSGTAPVADCGSGKLTQCVNLSAFTLPALYTYGNTPRNFLFEPNAFGGDVDQ
ncbi:MAG: TonB-dependent receptor, partial [Bryobacteraceae bacterium]